MSQKKQVFERKYFKYFITNIFITAVALGSQRDFDSKVGYLVGWLVSVLSPVTKYGFNQG